MQGFDVFDIGGYQLREPRFPSDLIHVEMDFQRLCLGAVQARYCQALAPAGYQRPIPGCRNDKLAPVPAYVSQYDDRLCVGIVLAGDKSNDSR